MKKYKRTMRGSPHKKQKTNQSKLKHLNTTTRLVHKRLGLGHLRINKGNISQNQTQLLSLLTTPFDL